MRKRERPGLNLSQARRIALGAQGFAKSRPAKVDRRHLRGVMERLGVLQLDTIPIICRPQHLVPYSRVGPYDPGLLDRIAYRDDEWFESWAHEAALVPMAFEPLFRWRQAEMAEKSHWSGAGTAAYVESVYDELAEQGPLLANQLSEPGEKVGTDHAWGGRSPGRLALGKLFAEGRAGSRRIGNFERQYDTIDRVVPAAIRSQPTPDVADAHRELLRKAAVAVGVGTADDLADYYRLRNPDARPRIAELVEEGTLVEVQVESWDRPAYRHVDSTLPRKVEASALLSPFDPVIWYRARTERLFGFHYRIEIYVPEAKRRFGYYVLPYLQGERIVGRVDVKAERADAVLRVKGAWFEPHADPHQVAEGLTTELDELARFQGLTDVAIEPKGNLAPYLREVRG